MTLALVLCAGCAELSQPADDRPGLNAREKHALIEAFYWRPERPIPDYTSERLDALLSRAANSNLDGERGENYVSELALALAEAGDQAFAASLRRQPEGRRREVAHSGLSYLWTHYHLRYPVTQALLRPYEPSQTSGEPVRAKTVSGNIPHGSESHPYLV